jgi:hypothetical protein
MVSVAQVRMLHEGLAEPAPTCETVPTELAPRIAFTEEQIRKGLPPPGPFSLEDIRAFHPARARHDTHKTIPFLEMP